MSIEKKVLDIEKKVLEINGFKEFNPMQKQALKADIFSNNAVVSAPTSSGKTIVGELAAINSIVNKKLKVIYTCPLRALASEHYHEFKKKYSKELKIKATISTGDFDSGSSYLKNFDLIYTTYEKCDSLLRHNASWLNSVGVLIVDEIHEIDSDRGPVIELVITKLKLMNPSLQVIGLSATIPNGKELASWLKAELIESDYRPVPLKEGIYFNDKIKFEDKEEEIKKQKDELNSLLLNTFEKEKQALIFANSRKRAESIARNLSSITVKQLNEKEKIFLKKHSQEILYALETPTSQCKSLSELVEAGAAFHHAGLTQKQRTIVEDLFRDRKLKAIASTPTLAAGINMPAHTVIIPSLYRYGRFGNELIPVREYKQMSGRAGRPKYDSSGRSILIARNEFEAEELMEKYVLGEIEEITSKLGIEPVLRMHLLALIASNFIFNLNSMEKFFENTFYGKQFRDMTSLFAKLNDLLNELMEMEFVLNEGEKFYATQLGRRVAELYLDPITANHFIKTLKENSRKKELAYLFLICDSFELYPYPSVAAKKESLLWGEMLEEKNKFFFDLNKKMYDDHDLLAKFQLAKAFNEWIKEESDESIIKEFNLLPGIFRGKLERADWLLYCLIELEKLIDLKEHFPELNNLRHRMKYGVREELLLLVQLKNIGRVRARLLFKNNVKGLNDLKKIELIELARILGQKIALDLKEQIGMGKEISEKEKEKLKEIERKGQTMLGQF